MKEGKKGEKITLCGLELYPEEKPDVYLSLKIAYTARLDQSHTIHVYKPYLLNTESTWEAFIKENGRTTYSISAKREDDFKRTLDEVLKKFKRAP